MKNNETFFSLSLSPSSRSQITSKHEKESNELEKHTFLRVRTNSDFDVSRLALTANAKLNLSIMFRFHATHENATMCTNAWETEKVSTLALVLTLRVIFIFKAWPNARTFQRNILQHCCMILRHVLNGLAKRTQHFQRNMWMFMCPRPLARNKWT